MSKLTLAFAAALLVLPPSRSHASPNWKSPCKDLYYDIRKGDDVEAARRDLTADCRAKINSFAQVPAGTWTSDFPPDGPVLLEAAKYSRVGIGAMLMDAGADPMIGRNSNENSWSVGLGYAKVFGDSSTYEPDHIAFCKMLIEKGIRIKPWPSMPDQLYEALELRDAAAEAQRPDALVDAAAWPSVEVVKALLAKGADPNAKGQYGQSALCAAIRKKSLPVVRALVEAGAGRKQACSYDLAGNRTQKTAAQLAAETGNDAIADLVAPAVAPPSAGGPVRQADGPAVSKEEMREMMQEAAAAAAEKAAAARPAAPQPSFTKDDLAKLAQDAAREAAKETSKSQAAPAPKRIVSDVDAPRYHDAPRPDDVALVVGVEKYNDLPDADFAERDAVAVRDHLLALGFAPRNVVLLTGSRASRSQLAISLEKRLPAMVKAGSNVFFYFSGHGSPDVKGKVYLLPSDGDPSYLEDTAYPLAKLYGDLGALKAKHVLVALDACFSGAGGRSVMPKGTRRLVNVFLDKPSASSVVSLTASGAEQASGPLPEQGHGVFTYYFLKGLSNGRRSFQQLYEYIKPNVEDQARLQNRDQSPVLTGPDAAL